MAEATPLQRTVQPGELIAELYAGGNGVHNIQIKDIDHTTRAAVRFMADPGVQKAVADVGGKEYIEQPVTFMPFYQQAGKGKLTDEQIRDGIIPFYGQGSDKPLEDLIINARKAGNQLRPFDHGYEDILGSFDHALNTSEQNLVDSIMKKDVQGVRNAIDALTPAQVENVLGTFKSKFGERISGHNDIVDGSFINVNSQGSPTLTLSGAQHGKLTDQLAVSGKTTDLTVFDSSKALDATCFDRDGKLVDVNQLDQRPFGDRVYDTATQTLFETSTQEGFENFAKFAESLPRDTRGQQIEEIIESKIAKQKPEPVPSEKAAASPEANPFQAENSKFTALLAQNGMQGQQNLQIANASERDLGEKGAMAPSQAKLHQQDRPVLGA